MASVFRVQTVWYTAITLLIQRMEVRLCAGPDTRFMAQPRYRHFRLSRFHDQK